MLVKKNNAKKTEKQEESNQEVKNEELINEVKNNNEENQGKENNSIQSLNINEIKEMNKKYDEQFEIVVNVQDKQYKVMIDRYFSPTKINDLVADLVKGQEKMTVKKVDIEDYAVPYYLFLLIKYFTNAVDDVTKDIFEGFEVMRLFTDEGILEQIFNSFPKDQIEFVTEKISELEKNYDEFIKVMAEKISNDEIKLDNENVFQTKQWAEENKVENKEQ